MADFPSLKPTEISYDLGGLNVSDESTITAGAVSFRHSLKINNNILSLQFTNLTQSEVTLIRNHYIGQGGKHFYFKVPSDVWGASSGSIVPLNSFYRYNSTPEEQQLGIYHNINVELAILTANDMKFILIGGGHELLAEESFTSFVFNGVSPFILNAGASSISTPTLLLNAGGAAT